MAAYVYDDATGWTVLTSASLPASGVGAGTYGDSTHVAQVTVNAEGIVTAASNVAVAGGGSISGITSSGGTLTVTNPAGPTTNLDMPNSGVAAGTYGDATDVSRITVDAQGRVTAASAVPISGIAGTSLTLLFDQTLGGTATVIDSGAGGFSTSYSHLWIFSSLRSDEVATNTNVFWQFNGDSLSSNYRTQRLIISGTTQTISNVSAVAGALGAAAAASSDANVFAGGVMHVVNYASLTPYKIGDLTAYVPSVTAGNNFRTSNGFMWTSTARISRVSVNIVTAGTHFIAGSRMTIYGVQ